MRSSMLFVVFRRGFAEGEVFGEQDVHGFRDEAGAGEVLDVPGPALGAVSGFFDQLAFGGGDKLFAGLDAAGRELEQELVGGVAVLADEQDAGVCGVGGGIDSEDDDRAIVAHDVALRGDAAGLGDLVGGNPEDAALVGGLGAQHLGFSGEMGGFAG